MSVVAGLSACLAASLLFGSVFVPIKKYPAGDGFTVQLFISLGAFLVSLLVHAVEGFPAIQPVAMIGGALWCTANAAAIPIMNRLGMAMGILIWNTLSCLTGWATSRYGLLGLPASPPSSIGLNYFGISVLIIGGIVYLFVESDPNGAKSSEKYDVESKAEMNFPDASKGVNNRISTMERVICVLGAVISGCFYGSMVTPITYIQSHPEHFPSAPSTTTPYLFSLFLGVISTSVVIFTVYALFRRNRPSIDPQLAVPALCSGLIFGAAMAFFLLANQILSQTIAYPLCAMAPGLVVSLWSVLYFREITGRRNILILAVAYCFTLLGVACVTISRDVQL